MKKSLLFLALILLACACGPISELQSKYVCSCDQAQDVANFMAINLESYPGATTEQLIELRRSGVMLLCNQRLMQCNEVTGEPYWHLPINQLDSCELYQF